jgi:hypothetical protein
MACARSANLCAGERGPAWRTLDARERRAYRICISFGGFLGLG